MDTTIFNSIGKDTGAKLYTRPLRAVLGGRQIESNIDKGLIRNNLTNLQKIVTVALIILFPLGLIYAATAAIVIAATRVKATAPVKINTEKMWENVQILRKAILRLDLEEGVFRISGSKDTVDEVIRTLPALKPEWTIHDMATALKQLIGVLKPFEADKEKYLGLSNRDQVLEFVLNSNDNFFKVIDLLRYIRDYKDVTKMSPKNLGVVFGPIVIDCPDLKTTLKSNKAFETLMTFA